MALNASASSGASTSKSPPPKSKDIVPVKPGDPEVTVLVRTSDSKDFSLSSSTAFASAYIRNEYENSSPNKRIDLPKVNAATLEKIIEFLEFHNKKDLSEMHRKQFNEKYTRMDTGRLCELASSAHALDIKALIHLTCRAIARRIEGKNPDEIRETFNIQNDLSLEEQYAPIPFGLEDARVRLLNQLYAKKRRELEDSKRPQLAPPEPKDIQLRPLDEVIAFINEPKPTAGDKDKKKKRSTVEKKKKDEPSRSSVEAMEQSSAADFSSASGPGRTDDTMCCVGQQTHLGETAESASRQFQSLKDIGADAMSRRQQEPTFADSPASTSDPASALLSLQQEVYSLRQRKQEINAIMQQLEQELKAVDARLDYLQDSTYTACLQLSTFLYAGAAATGSSVPVSASVV